MKVVIVILLLGLVSCTPKQRLDKLLTRHPYLAKNVTETVIDTNRITIPEVKHDTVTHITDTLIINKENLFVKTYYHRDSLYVFAKCRDTVIEVIDTVVVNNTIYEYTDPKSKKKWWEKLINSIWWIAILVLLGLYLPKIIKFVRRVFLRI